MKVLSTISSALVVVTGIYLTWYWYVAITERSNPGGLVTVVGRWQSNLAEWISGVGSLRLLIIFVMVVVTSLFVVTRRREETGTV